MTATPAATSEQELVTIPGVSRRVTITQPGMWSGRQVLVDGQPAKKGGWGKWIVPQDDGGEVVVRVGEGVTGLFLVVGKETFPVGPRVPVWLGVLVMLPIGLVAIGGILGGALGGLGWFVNRQIARMPITTGAKTGAMVGVFLAGLTVLLVLATLLHAGVGAASR